MADGPAIVELLERLANLMRSERRGAAGEWDLQPVHLSVLEYLARANRYSDNPASIAEFLGVTKGAASQTFILLERKGFLDRRPDAVDGRVVRLALTAAGRKVVAETRMPRGLGEALADLSTLDAENLETALRGLLRGLQRANGQRSFGVCRTCRFFTPNGSRFHCGLTGDPLSIADSNLICREHEAAVAS